MHRSGTSFLARALNIYGISLGNFNSLSSHDWQYQSDNLRGHWENKDIIDLAEKTLSLNSGSWDNVPKKISINQNMGKQISDSIKKIKDISLLGAGFKDPRILLVLDSWIDYIPEQFLIIGIFRDPLKVAESLKNRNGFTYEKSLSLWSVYNQKLLGYLDRYNGFLLNFDWPKEKLFSELRIIAKKLGLPEDVDLSEWYTKELFHSDKTYQSNYQLTEDVKLLYKNLQARSDNNDKVKINEFTHSSEELSKIVSVLLTEIQSQGNYFKKMFNDHSKTILQKNNSIDNLQKEFDERSKWAHELEALNIEKDKLLAELQKEFDKRSKWAHELEAKKDKLEAKKDKLEAKMNELEEKIKTKDSQIQSLQSKIIETASELHEIKNSYGFKILSKIFRRIDRAFPQSTRRGRFLQLVVISLTIIQNEGMRVFFQAFKDKIRSKVSRKKLSSSFVKQSVPKINLSFSNSQIDIKSNIFYNETQHEIDSQLRKDIAIGASNILNLPMFPKISIIIPTFDQVNFLKKCLSSIESKSTYKNYEIIIVTNNLDENSEMRKFLRTVKNRVLIFDGNYSFGAVNNYAAQEADGEFLLFLNDDVEIVSPNWLEALLKLGLDERVGAVGAKLLFPDGKLQEAGAIVWENGTAWNYGRNGKADDLNFNFVRDVDYCSAACLLVRKITFKKIRGFDLRYTVAYCEDTDLCQTIKDLGYRILYQPLACVIHHEGRTAGTDVESGIKSYQIQNERKFKEKWKHVLKTRRIDSQKNAFVERDRKTGANILYIDHYVPEYDKDSGSLTTFYTLGILSSLGNRITFWPENLNKKEPYVSELQQKGVEVIYGPNNFESFIKERGWEFHICWTTRPHVSMKFIDMVKKHAPHCKIVYDTTDLHFVREMREAKLTNDSRKFEKAKQTQENELKLIQKTDVTITKGRIEANIILNDIPSVKLAIVPPFQIPQKEIPPFNARKDILFVGGFQHPPNVDALEYLIKEIFPIIRDELQNVKLYIIGSNPTQKVVNLCNDKKNVVFLGYVQDIESYLENCRVLVAPLRYGAGIKGKITQSMAFGLPVVTTPIGAEDISGEEDEILIADNIDDFVKNVISLYRDSKLWTNLSNNGRDLIETRFSPESTQKTICQILEYCIKK